MKSKSQEEFVEYASSFKYLDFISKCDDRKFYHFKFDSVFRIPDDTRVNVIFKGIIKDSPFEDDEVMFVNYFDYKEYTCVETNDLFHLSNADWEILIYN